MCAVESVRGSRDPLPGRPGPRLGRRPSRVRAAARGPGPRPLPAPACRAARGAALAAYLDLAALPAADRERFRRALGFARQRTTLLLLELELILPAFADAGCRPVALKGAGLALGNYLRPEDRWFIDLDLLVTREELPQAYNALERVGYRFHDTARSSRYYEEHHFHRILRNAQGIFLEVHWPATLPASVYTFDLEALRRDAVERPLVRTTVRTPSARDQILHGVLQSIAGGYSDLRRILDLQLLDAALGDRMQLAAYATHHNLATGLWLQYRLREELMDVAMPREIVDRCAPPPLRRPPPARPGYRRRLSHRARAPPGRLRQSRALALRARRRPRP